MYGKFFASAFTGSMMGAGAEVFAVWAYVIANAVDAAVELNPRLVAAVIGISEEKAAAAIEILCAPDARSRSKTAEGRRLIREGEYAYSVPNHAVYRAIRSEDDRREYNRRKQAEHRARVKAGVSVKASVNDGCPVSAQSESDTDAEAYPDQRALPPRVRAGAGAPVTRNSRHGGVTPPRPGPRRQEIDLVAGTDRKLAELREAGSKAATPEEIAELRAARGNG